MFTLLSFVQVGGFQKGKKHKRIKGNSYNSYAIFQDIPNNKISLSEFKQVLLLLTNWNKSEIELIIRWKTLIIQWNLEILVWQLTEIK